MISAFWTSLMLGAIVTVISLAVAIPAAYVIVRMRTSGSTFLYNLFTAPCYCQPSYWASRFLSSSHPRAFSVPSQDLSLATS
jgi:ABC-type glycerol-3-phosphate transport system permease component